MNIKVGDFVITKGSETWTEVVRTDGAGQLQLSDGRWVWADETDLADTMTSAQAWKRLMR
jgi:hypothetical protein